MYILGIQWVENLVLPSSALAENLVLVGVFGFFLFFCLGDISTRSFNLLMMITSVEFYILPLVSESLNHFQGPRRVSKRQQNFHLFVFCFVFVVVSFECQSAEHLLFFHFCFCFTKFFCLLCS